ncbi:phasin [Oryzibacter oryziterrae]|uniref:phasin n=1 Tax=Oryzibacter oryziterrae TaxID=2766474 RepID=UPI001F208FE6|nr:phasin [Oryzibacter oryziterrae]
MTDEIKTTTTETKAAPKASRKPAGKGETIDAFAIGGFEMPEMIRDAAEKSAKQVKDAYDKLRTAAEEATDVIEEQIATTRSGVSALNGKVLENAKANVDASFQFVHDVLSVKSFAEVIELQTAFARAQFETASAQVKEFHELATKVATDTSAPVKDAFEKLFKDFKAA